MYDKQREQINDRTNLWLLKNFEKMKELAQETKEPIKKSGRRTCPLIIETAKNLYDSGLTHKQIGLLLGVSLSSAQRLVRHKNNGKRKH
jgi:transposase-like protein